MKSNSFTTSFQTEPPAKNGNDASITNDAKHFFPLGSESSSIRRSERLMHSRPSNEGSSASCTFPSTRKKLKSVNKSKPDKKSKKKNLATSLLASEISQDLSPTKITIGSQKKIDDNPSSVVDHNSSSAHSTSISSQPISATPEALTTSDKPFHNLQFETASSFSNSSCYPPFYQLNITSTSQSDMIETSKNIFHSIDDGIGASQDSESLASRSGPLHSNQPVKYNYHMPIFNIFSHSHLHCNDEKQTVSMNTQPLMHHEKKSVLQLSLNKVELPSIRTQFLPISTKMTKDTISIAASSSSLSEVPEKTIFSTPFSLHLPVQQDFLLSFVTDILKRMPEASKKQ